jgi:S-adenosylmethionine synthetase
VRKIKIIGGKMNITEKVSPMHPDKIADRIAGALVDYCYSKEANPKCAFEVLIGHNSCFITGETSISVPKDFVYETILRICGGEYIENFKYIEVSQDKELSKNQESGLRCGDNGVFAGFPMPALHKLSFDICKKLYEKYDYDGKIVLNADNDELTICWAKTTEEQIREVIPFATKINPLGYWTGGINVDTGITGRKLASDFYGIEYPLGGGTIHGKDLSKADCSVNIYCFLQAQKTGKEQKAICSIGDEYVNINGDNIPFKDIVETALQYISEIGGFEKLAEWGLR